MIFSNCCKLRTISFTIGILFLLVQTGFLILSFFMMRDVEGHVLNILNWLSDHGVGLTSVPLASQTSSSTALGLQDEIPQGGIVFHRKYIIRKSADYLAIPITINVVFIISDTLLIWASGARNKILIWPWMVLHLLELLFFIAALIFVMVILPEPWTKVVVFLICCPIIILLGFFWLVVKCFYNNLRDANLKSDVAAIYQNGAATHSHDFHRGHNHHQKGHNHPINPPTVYKPNPHSWDQPAPVWAQRPQKGSSVPKYSRNRPKNGKRRFDRVMELPGGTMVMPIDDEESDTNSNKIADNKYSLGDGSSYINPTFRELINTYLAKNKDDKVSSSPYKGSIRSLSTKFGQPSKLRDPLATLTSSSYAPVSEDRSSIISLSDKYRQQEEVEIFHEQFLAPPPEPVRPGQVSGKRFGGSSKQSSSYHSSTETFRDNFRL